MAHNYFYKIVEKDKAGNFRMLFHGLNRSRILPVGEWIKSERKLVSDCTNGTKYWSGWHVMKNWKDCVKYMEKFTSNKRKITIVECIVKGEMWDKEHSPSDVKLCEYIKILGEIVW